jgi:hypothetical protein
MGDAFADGMSMWQLFALGLGAFYFLKAVMSARGRH